MKIFMLCNVKLPIIAEVYGEKNCVFGGWLDEVSRFLSRDNELTICYMNDKNSYIKDKKNTFVGFTESKAEDTLNRVLNENVFDLFHIWGTEYQHSAICVSILDNKRLLNKCVVSIQGLTSVYAKHYIEGIPSNYLKRKTIRDLIFGNDIIKGLQEFRCNGVSEEKLLKKVKHVIGRTNWDKSCISKINQNAVYHFCNENLRKCFYDKSKHWDLSNFNRHTVFVSQCTYPVKGFHYLLKAMPMVLKKYPDAKIITTGNDFINVSNLRKKLSGSYHRYLTDLAERYRLNDKIVFRGRLTAEQMREQYLKAHVFVCPSTIENSPNSVGEAMISGCPVVASYVGGTMDMIKDGEEGYLYQTSSTEMLAYYICKVFEDDEKTVMMSEKARKKAEMTHDMDVNNSTLISIYKDITDNF